jgi:NAD+ synthase (glutamine-hydrolysing)
VLKSIVDTEISPELLPVCEDGKVQSTQETIGPYELHDFFLFHTLRNGFTPKKIFFLATLAFKNYPKWEILKWMEIFYRRFANAQYKRSCVPDGPKVGSVSLSPRGDWRMPSDADMGSWINAVKGMIDAIS